MAVTTNLTNKPINPRGNDQSPKGYNRAALFSGKALDFDGVNDTINVGRPSYMNITNGAITLACYARLDSTAANGHFFRQENGAQRILFAYQSNLDGLAFGTYNGSYSELDVAFEPSEKSAITNDVCFVVATQDTDGNRNIYLNGILIGGDTKSQGLTCSNSADLHIGSNQNAEVWNGLIGNAKIFDVALTAAQVADLYNNPEKIVPTGVADSALKLWLPMMEGAGTTCYDGSGNGNHGTISGATWTHGIGAPVAQTAVIDWNKGTNKVKYSEEFDNSTWQKTSAIVTADDTTAPDGSDTAEKIAFSATGSAKVEQYVAGQNQSKTFTVSVWAKVASGTEEFLLKCTQAAVADHFSDTLTVTTDWQRFTFTKTFSASSSTQTIAGVVNDTDAEARDIYFWGFQLEEASSAGPYVRTGATAQTSDVLLPQGLTTGRDITGVNLFENVRKQGALNLDGNSWAEVHDNASLDVTTGASVECWYYHVDQNTTKGIFGKWIASSSDRSYTIYMSAANQISFTTSNDGSATLGQATATTSFADDNWYHITGTFDGSNVKIYVNGTLETTTAASGSIYDSDAPVAIGHINGNLIYDQPIAQPRIYNRALTAEEVLQNYNSGKSIYQ